MAQLVIRIRKNDKKVFTSSTSLRSLPYARVIGDEVLLLAKDILPFKSKMEVNRNEFKGDVHLDVFLKGSRLGNRSRFARRLHKRTSKANIVLEDFVLQNADVYAKR